MFVIGNKVKKNNLFISIYIIIVIAIVLGMDGPLESTSLCIRGSSDT